MCSTNRNGCILILDCLDYFQLLIIYLWKISSGKLMRKYLNLKILVIFLKYLVKYSLSSKSKLVLVTSYNNDTLPSSKFKSSGPPLDSVRVDLNSIKCCRLMESFTLNLLFYILLLIFWMIYCIMSLNYAW